MKSLRLMHKHSARCVYIVEGRLNNGSPWYLPLDGPRARIYTQHWRRYVEFVCNDPDCKGRLRVTVDVLEDAAPSFLPSAPTENE